jgi:hypothetical protein
MAMCEKQPFHGPGWTVFFQLLQIAPLYGRPFSKDVKTPSGFSRLATLDPDGSKPQWRTYQQQSWGIWDQI